MGNRQGLKHPTKNGKTEMVIVMRVKMYKIYIARKKNSVIQLMIAKKNEKRVLKTP